MTTIINRSALEFYGHNPAPDVAYAVHDYHGRRVVTWAQVLEARREQQRRHLNDIRRPRIEWRAAKVWVAYYDMPLMGGWQAFIESQDRRVWIDRDSCGLIAPLMAAFRLLLPGIDDWSRWKVEFARAFVRRRQDGEPVGVAFLWWDGCHGIRKLEPDHD